MITFHIITLFPKSFSYLQESIIGRAQKNKCISVKIYSLREYGEGKHKITDDRPYGGGPGMVMKAKPILNVTRAIIGRKKKVKIIVFSPGGKQFTNRYARSVSKKYKHVVLIAGHYEGVDERVGKAVRAEKISVGPYIVTGGELPAMIVVDAVARQIKGVLGKDESLEEKRNATPEAYTRPEIIEHRGKKYRVPKVLLSGDHKKIEEWREGRL